MRNLVLVLFVIFPLVSYGSYEDPSNVVSYAINLFLKKDFSNVLKYTELSEKKRVLTLLEEYVDVEKKKVIDEEIKNVKSFSVGEVYYENEFCVVSTHWVIDTSYISKNVVHKAIVKRKILYLLKKFENGWKIISKKVEV